MKKSFLLRALVFFCLLGVLLTSCGAQGGISGAEINEDGELVLRYEDGSEQNLGSVVGKDGSDGVDGVDGADGSNGADGIGGTTVITGNNTVKAAGAKGLRSAVAIICSFTGTVQQGWRPVTQTYGSAGSGVIYQLDKEEGDAFIITNYHVVYSAAANTRNGISEDINVYLYGSTTKDSAIRASYVGGSLYYDIAVLRVEDSERLKDSNACAIEIADSEKVMVGDTAIAIGNAKGYGISVSGGIVSVDSEYITMLGADERTEVTFRVMRVDAAINQGNSGGGLFDARGELIGIVNAKIIAEGVEGIGYAIPSGVAISIADNIIDHCFGTNVERVQRALIGISVSANDSHAVYDNKTGSVSIRETVSIYEVEKGYLAEGVLQKGDILLSATVRGKTIEITRQHQAIDMLLAVRAGDVVEFRIQRDGQERTVSLTITKDCLTAY